MDCTTCRYYYANRAPVTLRIGLIFSQRVHDIGPEVLDAIMQHQELFTFSPFGLSCQQCTSNFTIQLDKRCISRHLKKHGIDNRVTTVSSLFDMFKAQLDIAMESGIIEPYRSNNHTYVGYSCICGQTFHSRKDSAIRHCKRLGCNPSKLQKVELIKLCCGRYVTQAQVDTLFNNNQPLRGRAHIYINFIPV